MRLVGQKLFVFIYFQDTPGHNSNTPCYIPFHFRGCIAGMSGVASLCHVLACFLPIDRFAHLVAVLVFQFLPKLCTRDNPYNKGEMSLNRFLTSLGINPYS